MSGTRATIDIFNASDDTMDVLAAFLRRTLHVRA
jgi:hypothetical protein